MKQNADHLFMADKLSVFLQDRHDQLRVEIQNVESNSILKANLDDLASQFTDKYKIEPLVLLRDQTNVDGRDVMLDVNDNSVYTGQQKSPFGSCIPATVVEFNVPFIGDDVLFQLQPPTVDTRPPCSKIVGREVRFRYVRSDHDPEVTKTQFERDYASVVKYIEWGTPQIEQFNNYLPQEIRQMLDRRKEKFLKDKVMVEGLGFPIRERANAPQTYSVPVQRKRVSIAQSLPVGHVTSQDPFVDMRAYEDILKSIGSMARVLELNPKAFSKMDEESLRFMLLVPLNIHYEGQATGETFNWEGKTDIIIKVGGRNVFIAECLVWDGPVYLKKKVDQLLDYTSWRDTKTAIVVFSRNKNLSGVLSDIPKEVKAHSNCKQEVASYTNETGFRYILRHRDDVNREFTLTVLVFDVPA